MIVQIELPSGSDHGPAVDKPSLIEAGTVSDPAFDLELGLAYLWDEAKRRNGGYRIHATRPEVLRNEQGHIVDTKDNVKPERNGKPSTRWDHPEAVLTGRQERHPQANRVRVLTRAERHRLTYGIIGDKHTSQIRNEQSATDRLLTGLEKDGRIVIERDAIDPPPTKKDGASWRRGPPDCMFYPVADYVLPCCRSCSTLLRGMFYPVAKCPFHQRKTKPEQEGPRTVGTVATELLFLPATLLRFGRSVAGIIVISPAIFGFCRGAEFQSV